LSASLASKIDNLFRTKLNAKGREYSYRDVADAVSNRSGSHRGEKISPAYVWSLRTGAKDNPTLHHVRGLARFFQVSPSYFLDDELVQLPDEARVLAATTRDSVRRLAVAALQLSDESVTVLLNLASHLRALEGLPGVAETAIIEVASAGASALSTAALGATAAPAAETVGLT
jgi:hypothetical protein